MIPRVATAGKTTLAKAIFPDKLYVSLENPDVLTGSAQFDLIFGVTQPLAGHVGRIEVIPTGLRSSEFVGATLGQIETDAQGDHWLKLVGKGSKAGKVALPPLARVALDHYLMQRCVPTTPVMCKSSTPLIADLQAGNGQNRITSTRMWNVTKRFFVTTADVIEAESPKTAEKLRRASPHWMRHTHATHALAWGRS